MDWCMSNDPFHYGSWKLKEGDDYVTELPLNVWRSNFYVACCTFSLFRITIEVSLEMES